MVAPLVGGHVASWLFGTSLTAQGAAFAAVGDLPAGVFWIVGLVLCAIAAWEIAGLRYIANNRVGVVEKLWSGKGSVPEGGIIALNGEAGFQAELLRGGLHFGYWRWQFRIHKMPLVTIPQGKIGYVYARDGEALMPSQTLGQVILCNNFQDARGFLGGEVSSPDHEAVRGQRGRQRSILREGVYAINVALFTVISEDMVYRLEAGGAKELKALVQWQNDLSEVDGVRSRDHWRPDPRRRTRSIPRRRRLSTAWGIVTVHDGPIAAAG